MTKNDFAGSSKYYDIILGKAFKKNAEFIAKILKKYKVKSSLELGCGSGLYLFPLKKLKFDIEGLDISKKMLAEARKQDKKIKLYRKDMSNFKINKKYDSILCLNSSLPLLPSFALMKKTIKTSYDHLKDKGILILDLPNHSVEIKNNNNSEETETYKTKEGQLKVTFKDKKIGNKWVSEWFGFIKNKQALHEKYSELIYDPKKLESALKSIGFKIVSLHGTRKGGTFNKNKSYRRVYVCIKKY